MFLTSPLIEQATTPPIGVSVEMRIFHRESEADEPTVEISLLVQKMKSGGGDRRLMQENRGPVVRPLDVDDFPITARLTRRTRRSAHVPAKRTL